MKRQLIASLITSFGAVVAAEPVSRLPLIPPPPPDRVMLVGETSPATTAAGSAHSPSGRATVSPWLVDGWDDGLAEVAEYTLSQYRYGNLHPGTATMIVVRETMDAQRAVKASRTATDQVPILKMHWVRSFQTGVYRYDQSSFQLVRRSDGIPLRWLITSHEWCGAAAKSWINGGALRVSSYFDGHGDLEQPLVLGPDAVPADSLWWWARAFVASGATAAAIRVIPSQIEARCVDTTPVPATVRVQPFTLGGDDGIPAVACWRVTILRSDGSADRLDVAQAAPHHLRWWLQADGSSLVLKSVQRFDYWAKHNPQDRP